MCTFELNIFTHGEIPADVNLQFERKKINIQPLRQTF